MDFFEKLVFIREQQSKEIFGRVKNDIKINNNENEFFVAEKNDLLAEFGKELRQAKKMIGNGEFYVWKCGILEDLISKLENVSSIEDFELVKKVIEEYQKIKSKRDKMDFGTENGLLSEEIDVIDNEENKLDVYKNIILEQLNFDLKVADILSCEDKKFILEKQKLIRIIDKLKEITNWKNLVRFQQRYEEYKKENIV